MLREIAYYYILGRPLVSYMGFLTITLFLLAAFVAISNQRNIHIIPFKWHSKIAITALIVGLTHGLLIAFSN